MRCLILIAIYKNTLVVIFVWMSNFKRTVSIILIHTECGIMQYLTPQYTMYVLWMYRRCITDTCFWLCRFRFKHRHWTNYTWCGYKITGVNFFRFPVKLATVSCVLYRLIFSPPFKLKFQGRTASSLGVVIAWNGSCSCSPSESC